MPLNLQPKFFPVDPTSASLLITAAQMELGDDIALQLAGAVLRAVWVEEKNIADPSVLADLLKQAAMPASLLEASGLAPTKARYQAFTDEALACGVFGSPSYVVDGEIFWGQDRLDFLQRRLSRA